MDRRSFGKMMVGGAAGSGAAFGSGARVLAADGPAPKDLAYRVFPDLPVRYNDKIRTGGDYHTRAGKDVTDHVSLDYFRRFNARWLTVQAHNTASKEQLAEFPHFGGFLNADGPWDLDQLKRMQDDCHRLGMIMEAVRMDSAYIIMKEGPVRDRYLDIIRENIRKAAAAGATLVTMHWTMIPIYRNFNLPGRGGSTYNGFKLEPNWKDLPVYGPSGRVSLDDYWGRIEYFLKGVLPVCHETKVKLGVHPYDPGGLPLGYRGVDNWDAVDYAAALKKYALLVDDPYNCFTYECGVAGESLPDPNTEINIMRWLAERGKIAQVHFRSVRGHQNNFVEVYLDEGDCPMFNCLKVLRDTGWEGTLLPDHNPVHPDDPGKLQAYAFSYGYMEGLIKAAKEEAIRATRGI
ncbi:MAG TPA: mannonate dehydratase [Rhizomicrobium sp.]|nr:mannonate dehydratase [Rhizomicrobium sp.]